MKQLILVFIAIHILLFESVAQEKRIALVIGNAAYNQGSLKNPVNDANLMETTLKQIGFTVIKRTNATKAQMEQAVRQFSENLGYYNVALFFYAGHGMQAAGVNYLIPVDAKLAKESDLKYEAVPVNFVVEEFEQYPRNTNIVILDACRDNPMASWARSGARGFKAVNPSMGTIIAFATAEGSTASDGEGSNGLFTSKLVKQMQVPQPIESVFKNTRVEVVNATNGNQRPQEWSMLTGNFQFVGGTPITQTQLMDNIKIESNSVVSINGAESSSITDSNVVYIDGGTFTMGSATGLSDETTHIVNLGSFSMMKYEVTFAQYDAFCEATGKTKPSDEGWGRGNMPVINVSWHDANDFAKWLSQKTSKKWRLPTEAEWEFAAKGGLNYLYVGSNNIDEVAWHSRNSGSKTQSIGQKKPNGFGLYDMTGNVWEWCSDWYSNDYYNKSPVSNPQGPDSGSYRVLRGGSWYNIETNCRIAFRYNNFPDNKRNYIGFRLVLVPSLNGMTR